MKPFKSFRVRIFILLLLLTVTTISVFSVIITDQMTRLAKQEAYKDISEDCISLKNQINLHLSGVETCIYQLAVSDAFRKMDVVEMDQMSQALIRKLPIITQIYVMDKTGMQIYKSSFPETMGDRSDRDYFMGAIAGRSVFSDVIVSRSTLIPIVVHAQPIIRGGKVDSVLGASIDLTFLSNVAAQIRSGSDSYGFIVDASGRTIGHPNPKFVADMLDLSYLDPVAAVMSGKSGTGRYTFEGIRKLVAYMPLGRADWGVLVQTTEKEAFQNIDIIRKLLIMTTFGLVLASVIGTYRISRYLEKPIDDIIRAIGSIEKDSDFPPYCSLREDEFGIIENALVSMADTVYRDKVELEERVEIRTNELKQTMDELVETQEELMQSNANLAEAFEKLKIAQNEITQVEKMAALDRMTSSLAHGLNTPLGTAYTMVSYVEQLFSELKIPQDTSVETVSELTSQLADAGDGIRLIHRQLSKAIELIKVIKIPAFAENSHEDRRETDLCVYLNSRMTELRTPLMDTHHSLAVTCLSDQCIVLFPDVLLQILIILITNSVEHGFVENEQGKINIEISQTEETVRVALQNNGKLIRDSEMDHIFEPFYKESMSGQGKGVGLTIAYAFVEKFLEGRITCRNLEPEGVEFAIVIPRALSKTD